MIARASGISGSTVPGNAPTDDLQTTAQAGPTSPIDQEVFPHHTDAIPPGVVAAGSYELRFAWTRSDLHDVQSLRYRAFHDAPALGEDSDVVAARDEDERDPWFHHLMIVHRESRAVVGTYRLQTAVMAATRFGFYSAEFFELGAIPARILADAVEVGRACVAPAHRNGRVLHLLWRGLARYLTWNSKRYLFGCCSVSSLDPLLAFDTWRSLHARNAMHEQILVRPRPLVRALADDGRSMPANPPEAPCPLPSLFEGYLGLGAKVCGSPAFDREFGTTDYLVLLDTEEMPQRARDSLFS